MQRLNLVFTVVLVASVVLIGTGSEALGEKLNLLPTLEISGEYDDNVLFERDNEIDDYLLRVSPAIKLDYRTELSSLRGGITLDVLRYEDETDLNTENQRYEIDGSHRASERVTLNGDFSYIRDTTLESELEETGLVNVRQDRDRWNAGAGLAYKFSAVSDLIFDYSHSDTDYEFESSVDHDSDTVRGTYQRRLKTQRDVLMARPYYSRTDSDVAEVDTYGLYLGWWRDVTETLRLQLLGGIRYTDIDYLVWWRDSTDEWGVLADISITKRGERFEYTAGYMRDLTESALGEPVERDRLYASAGGRITERLRGGCSGSLYFTESEGDFENEDSRYFTVSPYLAYRLTENHRLRLGYRYAQSYDKTLADDERAERNRVWLTLELRFPRNL